MQIADISSFLDYYQDVRARTRRLLTLILPERLEWSWQPSRFTLSDQVRHIAAIKRFLCMEMVLGRRSRYVGCGPELAVGDDATRVFFDRCHAETLHLLRTLSAERLHQKSYPLGGVGITVWKWLRLRPEHEIHHRGQLYVYLAMLGIKTTPIFGLTSETVALRSFKEEE